MKKLKNLKIIVSALLLFAVLAGIGYALIPPPPPPPPVPQDLGLGDRGIDKVMTNATDQSACRGCHLTSGTSISGGYSNTVGGVPTRHHSLAQRASTNPYTGTAFNCQQCHPTVPGTNGVFVDRSCVNCHNGTSWWGDSAYGGRVGNFSRPHHVNTSYASSNIGNPVADRQCKFCHGSFVASYNDNHYKPTYATDFMITPFASFKVTSNEPLVGDLAGTGNKTWGGCYSCHMADSFASPAVIESNHDTHHKEILGMGRFGGQTSYQNASTPGEACNWCHVIAPGTTSPLRFNITNDFTGELLVKAMEVRNSTIEAVDVMEPGTTNISINGTGCQKCHDVKTLHNIQKDYVQNGVSGKGHINNDADCNGCHNSWVPADTGFTPGALIPSLNSVEPSVLIAGSAVTLTITGENFVNDPYTSVVDVDGVQYTPATISDTQITVDIPALSAGIHQLKLVKGGDTDSKVYALSVVSNPHITSARLNKGTITITGTNFGVKPTVDTLYYVTANHAGQQLKASQITSWSNTVIKAKITGAAIDDVVTVITGDSGQTTATITR